jgi:hypothetical protein
MTYLSTCIRYPAQQKVGGDSKIPSIIFYDKEGQFRAAGAEALQESLLEQAEDQEWTKVEWYPIMIPNSLLSDTNHNAGLNSTFGPNP